MTDDRELLEDAAKAAGVPLKWPYDPSTYERVAGVPPRRTDTWDNWNPLTDDGDSARLRRSLRIVVQWFPTDVAAMNWNDGRGRSWAEPYGDDPAAAERLAVVRAAAALAKDTA